MLASLPVLVPVFLAVLLAACTALMLVREFSGPLAFVIAVVVTGAVVPFLGLGDRVVPRQAVAVDLLALLLALSFAGINAKYASQNIIIGRDPGVYAVTSEWLVHHKDTDIDAQNRLFGSSVYLQPGSAGLGRRSEPGHAYPQGLHGLPAVLSVVGSFFGTGLMFKTNALIGGFALFAVYGFGRRVVGRWGALVAAGLLGASLPQIAFSRDTYTEPLSQLLLFGGLALLLTARPGRRLDWLVAGLVVAGGCLTRIDSFLTLPPLLLYAGLRLAVTSGEQRRQAARDTGFLLAGAVVPAVLGYLDIKLFAPGYLFSLQGQFRLIEELVVASAVAGAVLVLAGWRTPLLGWVHRWRDTTRARLGLAVAGLIVLTGAVLAARPLFLVDRSLHDPGQLDFVAAIQQNNHLAVDPRRSYAEHSVTWLTWYLGPGAVVLGLLGLAVLVYRAVRRGELTLVPFFFAFALTGLNYLVKPSITPDQIWAMRRFVPIVLPGVALGAMVLLVPAFSWLAKRSRPAVAVATVLVGAALLVPVVQTTRPYARVAEGLGQLTEVQHVCDALPDDAGVLVLGALNNRYPMTLRTFCRVPAGWSTSPTIATPKELAQVVASLATHGRTLWVVGEDDVPALVTSTMTPESLNAIEVKSWQRTLTGPPRETPPVPRGMYVGKVGPDGRVVKWATR